MGTPGKQRRKYSRPTHPWKLERITEETEICAKYGLKNKREIWKTRSRLARIRDQAKSLLTLTGEEAEAKKRELISKMNVWGINAKTVDDILALDVNSLLDRRLESVVFRKGLAKTYRQARQYIVHNHVFVGSHKVSIPGYVVLAAEEESVRLSEELLKVKESGGEEVKEAG
jgi:small subunit ribosomal protein S4